MGRFYFEELDRLSPLEQLCKEWYLSSMQSLIEKTGDFDILTDSMKHNRIPEAMAAFPPHRLVDTGTGILKDSSEIPQTDTGEGQIAIKGLEIAWKDLRDPKVYCDWNDLFPESTDTLLRYHDRYYPVTLHNHNFFEIVYLVKGRCTHKVGNDMIEMQRGDVVIVPPGTLHALFSYNDENIVFNMHISSATFEQNFLTLLVSHNILGKFFRQTLYSKEDRKSYFIIHTGDYFLGDNILSDIWQEMSSELPYQRDMLNTQVKLLFLHLLRHYSNSMFMAMIDSDDSETIVDMMAYIQTNFRDITVEMLCEKYKYSKRQIFRLIQRYVGSTLGDLQKELRMKHAARLLTSSRLTVEEIAADCGYKSTNNFYVVFKEAHGLTPLAYRKVHRQ